jgi:hypothetical protein
MRCGGYDREAWRTQPVTDCSTSMRRNPWGSRGPRHNARHSAARRTIAAVGPYIVTDPAIALAEVERTPRHSAGIPSRSQAKLLTKAPLWWHEP